MNYTDLVEAAKAYADRNDVEVTGQIDTFILMVESRINRVLKTREQSARSYTPTVTDQEYYSLPTDFAGMRNIQVNSLLPIVPHTTLSYKYLTPEQFDNKRDEVYNGQPYFTLIANQLQIWPTLDAGQSIEMVYYQKVPNLNSTDTNNWLSDSHPDIYLAGITAEIEMFAKNYDVGKIWYDRMSKAINELDQSDIDERWSGVSLETRVY